MAVKLYMDHNVPRVITDGLRTRGVDVITSYEDGTSELDDSELLNRATELGRTLFTRDYDLLQEATCIRDLEVIAQAGKPEDIEDRIEYLPL